MTKEQIINQVVQLSKELDSLLKKTYDFMEILESKEVVTEFTDDNGEYTDDVIEDIYDTFEKIHQNITECVEEADSLVYVNT